MKLIFTSYASTTEFSDPDLWLKRIEGYTGILKSLSSENTVIGIERINYEGLHEQHGVLYYFIRQRKKTVLFPFRIHRLIKSLQPEVVFVNGLIFPLQLIQLKLKLVNRVKIIVLHRGEKPCMGLKGFLQKLADKMVDGYLFTSAEFGKEWTRFGNIGNQKKIYEVIQGSSVFYPQEKTRARTALNISGAPLFLWVGRLDRNKDPITVVKAFLKFAELQPKASLYMIYQEDELLPEIKNIIRQVNKSKEAIRLIGKIPHQQLLPWYNSADFIISGSHHEGSGIAVCEAMSCGCVPVLTDIISFRRMTGPGKCGLLYEPGNAEMLFKALLQASEMDIEKEGIKTLEQFKKELSFEAIAKKINTIISSL